MLAYRPTICIVFHPPRAFNTISGVMTFGVALLVVLASQAFGMFTSPSATS